MVSSKRLVYHDGTTGRWSVDEEGLAYLEAFGDRPVAPVSIIGPCQQGKSSFANFCGADVADTGVPTEIFRVGTGNASTTTGIDVHVVDHGARFEGSHGPRLHVLLDVEGEGDTLNSESYELQLMATVAMLSSSVVFNTKSKTLTKGLGLLERLEQLFEQATSPVRGLRPHVDFLLRDYELEPPSNPKEWLRRQLEAAGLDQTGFAEHVSLHHVGAPGPQGVAGVPVQLLKPKFLDGIRSARRALLEETCPLQSGDDRPIYATAYVSLIRAVVDHINQLETTASLTVVRRSALMEATEKRRIDECLREMKSIAAPQNEITVTSTPNEVDRLNAAVAEYVSAVYNVVGRPSCPHLIRTYFSVLQRDALPCGPLALFDEAERAARQAAFSSAAAQHVLCCTEVAKELNMALSKRPAYELTSKVFRCVKEQRKPAGEQDDNDAATIAKGEMEKLLAKQPGLHMDTSVWYAAKLSLTQAMSDMVDEAAGPTSGSENPHELLENAVQQIAEEKAKRAEMEQQMRENERRYRERWECDRQKFAEFERQLQEKQQQLQEQEQRSAEEKTAIAKEHDKALAEERARQQRESAEQLEELQRERREAEEKQKQRQQEKMKQQQQQREQQQREFLKQQEQQHQRQQERDRKRACVAGAAGAGAAAGGGAAATAAAAAGAGAAAVGAAALVVAAPAALAAAALVIVFW